MHLRFFLFFSLLPLEVVRSSNPQQGVDYSGGTGASGGYDDVNNPTIWTGLGGFELRDFSKGTPSSKKVDHRGGTLR